MDKLSLTLARRLARNTNATGRTGSIIAILGVAFALAVMEITLAVSVGFKKEITEKLLGFVAPVALSEGNQCNNEHPGLIKADQTTLTAIEQVAPKADVSPSLLMQGMIKTDGDFEVVVVKGYERNEDATFEKSNIIKGRWPEDIDKRELVVSEYTANRLGAKVGDRVSLCYFGNDDIKARPFEIVGIYDTGFAEYDKLMAYAPGNVIRTLYHCAPETYSLLELRNVPLDSVDLVASQLKARFAEAAIVTKTPELQHTVTTIKDRGGMYLNWLDLLDTNVVVIFILMALVAMCTIISGLFIQVLEKINAIGLLRSLGATNRQVGKVFVYISLRLVGWGMLFGNIIGLGFILCQSQCKFFRLDAGMYYLNYVPVSINPLTIVILNIAVIAVAWCVLILPARIATRLSPAVTLRYD